VAVVWDNGTEIKYFHLGKEITAEESHQLLVDDPKQLCVDCGMHTYLNGHDYMVRDDVWPIGTYEGKMCLDCLETRLERPLVHEDFLDLPIHDPPRSEAVAARLRVH
jgi:hypothetical protein